ncbi:MAG TPA: FAD-linked oxidase C-terminal domain-containing protein [Acidobacteriaceae bacterium]|nr:FAD-linked oxidase C-terminal domain-containing protein [Acidobacteriaceae bacterium]
MLDKVILAELRAAVDGAYGAKTPARLSGVITTESQLKTYECDGLTNFRVMPAAVVLPQSAKQVQAVVQICAKHKIPFVARGSGTGLSGGALPAESGVVISFARMNRILQVDIPNQRVVVEPGVINQHVTDAVAAHGYFYAPDPSSQSVCTIGGNVAENAGGAHCLKYGFTTTHVLGMDVVLPTGEMVTLGSAAPDAPGYDLTGVFVGSEGTLGVATKLVLRIVKRPETVQVLLAAFDSISAAGQTVSDVIAAGMLPAAMEIMDRLSAQASEAAVHPNYPVCEALLLIELDGAAAEVASQMAEARALCEKNGAWEIRQAQTAEERALIWKGRKAAFAAMGRISPNYIVQDGVIPRTALPEVLEKIARMAGEVKLRVANVFHAGDGNLHPMVLYDQAIPGQEEIALDLSYRILYLCVDHGGSITGEHGVGREKQQAMGYMFSEPDLETMQRVRRAFDPQNIANPDKVFPRTKLCGEKTGPYTPHPLEQAGVAEYF